jgi:hypothetical protein
MESVRKQILYYAFVSLILLQLHGKINYDSILNSIQLTSTGLADAEGQL